MIVTPMLDAELVQLVRNGVAGAYADLYRRHVDGARRRARGPDDSFRTYLLTGVRNEAYQDTRSRRREVLHPDMIEVSDRLGIAIEFGTSVAAEARSARAALTAFKQLPERWQMVLRLADLQGKPHREVAPYVDLTNTNSGAQLRCRARRALRAAYFDTLSGTTEQGVAV